MSNPIRVAALAVLLLIAPFVLGQVSEPSAPPEGFGERAQVELVVPPGAQAGPDFDVEVATRAWLDTVSAEDRARSDAYFEGGYWISLWGLLYSLGVLSLLLFLRWSSRIRSFTARTRFAWVNAGLFGMVYTVVTSLLFLPWVIYTGYVREHQYGLSNLTLGEWFGEHGIGLAVSLVVMFVVLAVLYAVFRRVRESWWMWATGVSVSLLLVLVLVAPVFISPLFNDYKPLPEGELRTSILSLARASGISVDNVYWVDQSRQHSRISANVQGLGPSIRISLNDNLLMRSPRESIESVMGHEMGHYVLNHVPDAIAKYTIILFIGFGFTAWGFRRLTARYGERWDVRGIDDPAGWPVIVALFSVYFFVMTPVTNSITRVAEMEADLYGIISSQQPDGFAYVAIQLGQYRKLEPTWLEEIVFFDHPSGRTRVRTAMEWKAENLEAAED